MCPDALRVALIMPNVAAYSGGIERTLKLIEYSESANLRYTGFVPPEGLPNAEVEGQLDRFRERGLIETRVLGAPDGGGGRFDAIAVPTEYWWGAWKRSRAGGLRGPCCVDVHQLPYIGTLDILKAIDIDNPSLPDVGKMPFLQRRVYGDGLLDATFQAVASVASVRWFSTVRDGMFMAVTPVVAKNLAALGYRGPTFVPQCPNGIDRAGIETQRSTREPVEFDAIYVGRFHPQKGFLDVPQIVAHLRSALGREPKVAVCGGSGLPRHMAQFQESARGLGVEENLEVLGRIPKADLYRTMRRAKVLLYPSYVDGFSLTVLESLCLAVPVAAYNIDAVRMIWSRREAVYSAPVGNARALGELMSRLDRSGELREARKAAERQSAALMDEYTWEGAVADERRFYENAIEVAGS
jgi:glycosyltransferase involved in cell wall biosynthesis